MTENRAFPILLCRFCLSLIFIVGGIGKAFNPGGWAASHTDLPFYQLLPYVAVFIELGGGLAILFGLWTRLTSVLFVVYVIATMFIGHRFWEFTGPARAMNETQFLKNVTMLGGFGLLAMTGPGRFAIDAVMRGKRAVGVA